MSKILSTLLMVLLLAGCNSGEVIMSEAQSQDNATSASGQIRSSSAPDQAQAPIVYFDRVSLRDSKPDSVVGLGFLREGALTQSAFGLRFKTPGILANRPRLETSGGGITYLKPDATGRDRLLRLDPETLADTELARLPQGARSIAVSADLRSLAWIDSRGNVLVAINGASAAPLPAGDGDARMLAFATDSNELEVQRTAGSTIFDRKGSPVRTIQGFPFAMEPGTGRTAAGLSASGLAIQVQDSRDGSQVSIPVQGRAIHSLQWSSAGTLAFVLEHDDGSLALMMTRPETGEADEVAQLTLTASTLTDRIICPVWYGDSLYFGDATSSSFAIFRATREAGEWNVQPFARTGSSLQGFVCPKISLNSGGNS